MDVIEIRRRNVTMLVDQAGGPTKFGKVVERDQSQVSQWLGEKPIGRALARHIEKSIGKELGWLDRPQWEGPVASVNEPIRAYGVRVAENEADIDDPESVWIHNSDIRVSGGPGAFVPEFIQAEGKAVFQMYWFRSKGAKPQNVKRVRVSGSSMEPRIFDGDMVVIDTARREIEDGRVYVIYYGGLKVKRLFLSKPGEIRIASDNPDKVKFGDDFVSGEDLNHLYVIGRVIDVSGSGGL
jgi:phage repressor protein C with HTH and peptisase S24 domain